MKKFVTFLVSIWIIVALSVTALAAEKPETLFWVKVTEDLSFDEVASYAEENGFSAVVLDFRGKSDGKSFFKNHTSALPYYLFCDESGADKMAAFSENDRCLGSLSGDGKTPFFYLPYGDDAKWAEALELSQNGGITTVFVEIPLSCYSESGYASYLARCLDELNVSLVTVNDLDRVLAPVLYGDFFGDPFELCNQYLINKQNGVAFCVSDYRALLENRNGSAAFLLSGFSSTVLEDYADFSLSQRFAITRPTGSSLTVDTEKYTIFGTSDPTLPLYMDDSEIERISTSGLFAVTVSVPKSGATYTFRQGGKTFPITLKRNGSDGVSATTTKITSAQPTGNQLAVFGESVTFSCVAPSGASVTVRFLDTDYPLTQVAYADPGVPAKFKSEPIALTDGDRFPYGQIACAGNVVYQMNYKGTVTTATSAGFLYVQNGDTPFVVKANCEMAGVEREPVTAGDYLTTLRTGCTGEVTQVIDGWYGLSSGGYLRADQADILTGETAVQNTVSSVRREIGDTYEKLIFSCSVLPCFYGEIGKTTLSFRLTNTGLFALPTEDEAARLTSGLSLSENEDNSVTLTICSKDTLWGWDVFTNEEEKTLTLVLKKRPTLSHDLSKPLSGLTVAVCSGHGGPDPGALSVAGEKGVNEAQINLANTMAIADSLERLGAKTLLLVSDGSKLDTYGRTDPAREALVDVYICCHANSVDYNANANLWCGTNVYYHYPHSAVFSQKLTDYIAAATGRDNEGSHQDYYSVTRLTLCPAVMLEVGFVSNPRELESLIDPVDIQKTALAVTKAVLEIVDN